MAIRQRNQTWYWYRRVDGKIREVSLGRVSRDEALSLAVSLDAAEDARRKAERLKRLFSFAESTQDKTDIDGVPLSSLLEIARRHRRISPTFVPPWEKFVASIGVKYAEKVTPNMCSGYLQEHLGCKSAGTYNSHLSALKVIWRSAMVDAGIASNPFDNVLPRVNDTIKHYRAFTRDEMARIFANPPDCKFWAGASIISAYTGLRLETCRRLAPCHINDGVITITPSKTARFGRAVQIPLFAPLASYLANLGHRDANTPYLARYNETPHWPGKNEVYFTGYLHSLGIVDTSEGKASFHSFRDTFVTRMSELGIDGNVIRGIVGHSNERMTDLYNHDTGGMIRAVNGVDFSY